MKNMRWIKLSGIILISAMVFMGCRQGNRQIELTNFSSGTIDTFSRKTGLHLVDLGSGNYEVSDIVHVNATKNQIISITLMEQASGMQIYKVGIGMTKEEVSNVLKGVFTDAPLEKVTGEDEQTLTNIYYDNEHEFKVTYNTQTNTVTELTLSNKEKEDAVEVASNGNLAIMIGGTKVYYNEAMVYLKSIQQRYEKDYGNEIWSCDILGDGHTFGDMMKEEIMKQIMELKIIGAKAAELNINLSEEELSDARKLAREHYSALSQEDIDAYHFTQELLVSVYNDNMLAEKVYETVTLNINTDVSDFNANQRTVQHIFLKNYKLGEDGTKTPISAEEKSQAYEKMEELYAKALETEDFYSLAENNSQDEILENTFGRANPAENYPQEFLTAAYSLKTGDVSNIITTADGWYLIYCVLDYNEDATIALKEDIIEQRRSEMFSELYTEWSAGYDVVINSETWKSMQFKK